MKIPLLLVLCLSQLHIPAVHSFGCSPEMCSYFTALSPYCCILAHTCCKEAVERLRSNEPQPECKTSVASEVAQPSIARAFPFPLPPLRWI